VETGRAAVDLIRRALVEGERIPREASIASARYDHSNIGDFVPWEAR
jgi:hypothetical protein